MSEIGIIGQMYEDRRTKKTGKLIERDEKYKTLLFESPDGKTFNTSYGTFKSNYRKYESAGETTTEVEKIEEVAETEHKVVEVTEKPVKKQKELKSAKPCKRGTSENLPSTFTDYADVIIKYMESFNNPNMTIATRIYKRTYLLKFSSRVLMNLTAMARTNTYTLWITEPTLQAVNFTEKPISIKGYEGFARCVRVEVPAEKLAQYLEDLKPVFIDFISDLVMNNKKEEE